MCQRGLKWLGTCGIGGTCVKLVSSSRKILLGRFRGAQNTSSVEHSLQAILFINRARFTMLYCTGQSDIRHAGSNRCASALRHMRFLSLLALFLALKLMVSHGHVACFGWSHFAGRTHQIRPLLCIKQSN